MYKMAAATASEKRKRSEMPSLESDIVIAIINMKL
jgi:hypothetical protein